MTYVVNLKHFLDEEGRLAPGRPGKHARHYARIVEAATPHPVNEPFLSVVPCRLRPGRKPCPGKMVVCRRQADTIVWQCSACDYEGILSGWEGTDWDLSCTLVKDGGADLGLTLTSAEYAALTQILTSSPEAQALLSGAVWSSEAVTLWGSLDAFDLLVADVIASANHLRSRKKQAVLDVVSDKMTALVGGL